MSLLGEWLQPKLGKRPAFLEQTNIASHSSPLLYNRANTFLKEGKPQAISALRDYLNDALIKLEAYRIVRKPNLIFDDQVIESISLFLPHRNEILQIIHTSLIYAPTIDLTQVIHKFLEGIAQYTCQPENITSYNTSDFDNFKYIAKELFLNIVGLYLKEEKFADLDRLLIKGLYFRNDSAGQQDLQNYSVFSSNCASLGIRNDRLSLGRMSLVADLLKDRSFSSPLTFEELMQADFILMVRSRMLSISYWADTLVYLDHFPRPFEVFIRAASREYFERAKLIFGVKEKRELEEIAEDTAFTRPFAGRFLNLKSVLNIDEMCTRE